MQAIILAGGKGTRLHPLTTDFPKPMVPLFDRPVMEHTIELLSKHGISDIIVTVSYLARDIMDYFGDGSRWGVRIRYSVEHEPLGTAGAVKLVREMIDDTFLVVSGDAVTDFDLSAAISRHRRASAIATMLLYQVDEPTQFGLVQHDEAGKVTRFLEKPRSSEVFTDTVNTGIYILEPDVLSCIPYDQPCDFARQIFPAMLNNREPIYGFSMPGYWCDVGNLGQYRSVHFDALTRKVELDLPATHIGEGIWIGERVAVDPSVEIAGPVYIGEGTTVHRGAILGERAIIGSESTIEENARIRRSVVGSRSMIGKGAQISDCIIGDGYNLADSESVSDRTLVSHVKYQKPTMPSAPATVVSRSRTLPQVAHESVHSEKAAA
ncbi:MAG: NDP-sugar synthase [Armatimonadota bacterium]|nr:NDP-sugar synthase [bacterium]